MSERGERAIQFIEMLRHSTGEWAGKPLLLEDWQKQFIQRLFGTLDKDGLRQFREAFLFVPRKNGKSQIVAAVALYMLVADGEHGAQIYSAASSHQQASLVFQEASRMVRQNKTLSKLLRIVPSQKCIVYEKTNSVYKAISADSGNKSGLNASCVIYDELHEAKNRDLYDVLKTSMGARRQPLFISITTAGDDLGSFCYEQYQYAKGVGEGRIKDPHFLPVIFEAEKTDDPGAESTWRKANPNYGVSIKADYLKERAERAKNFASELNSFLRYHLNVWVDTATQFLPTAKWLACGQHKTDIGTLEGRECWGGLDLSTRIDLTAFVLVFPVEDKRVAVVPHFWLPRETAVKNSKGDGIDYLKMASRGFITLQDGNCIDQDEVFSDIEQIVKPYKLRDIGLDRYKADYLTQQFQKRNLSVTPYGQGFISMDLPIKELEGLVHSERLVHWNNPVMDYCARNAKVQVDPAGNYKLTKAKDQKRIDGMVAMGMALGRMLTAQPPEEAYDGLLVI